MTKRNTKRVQSPHVDTSLGNTAAGILFLVVAIYDFTQDDSGIGVVFVILAAVFLGLGLSGLKKQQR